MWEHTCTVRKANLRIEVKDEKKKEIEREEDQTDRCNISVATQAHGGRNEAERETLVDRTNLDHSRRMTTMMERSRKGRL